MAYRRPPSVVLPDPSSMCVSNIETYPTPDRVTHGVPGLNKAFRQAGSQSQVKEAARKLKEIEKLLLFRGGSRPSLSIPAPAGQSALLEAPSLKASGRWSQKGLHPSVSIQGPREPGWLVFPWRWERALLKRPLPLLTQEGPAANTRAGFVPVSWCLKDPFVLLYQNHGAIVTAAQEDEGKAESSSEEEQGSLKSSPRARTTLRPWKEGRVVLRLEQGG